MTQICTDGFAYSLFALRSLFRALVGGRKFSLVTTLLPVFCSNSRRARRAIVPPFFPADAFSIIPAAATLSAICRVESSASAVKIS